MHGRIWLESELHVGTTVTFTVPYELAKRHTNGEIIHQGLDPSLILTGGNATAIDRLEGIPRSQVNVCIAEDNPINQKIALSFVHKLGLKPKAYPDGQQAIDALIQAVSESKPFHVVLMDIQMPVLDGYGATRQIRRHSDAQIRDVLIVAMTASAVEGDRERCLSSGMDEYLAKPVRLEHLRQVLARYINMT